MKPIAIDLFSGCGGLSQGLKQAGFQVQVAVEIDTETARTYKLNHPETRIINKDIREVGKADISKEVNGKEIDLIAGCPPCQGFSKIGNLNKKNGYSDSRNELVIEFFRIVELIKPNFIMLENVPGLSQYSLFNKIINDLSDLGYYLDYKIVDIANYGVPQRRKRLVLLGSKLGPIAIPQNLGIPSKTVRDFIYQLSSVKDSNDPIHKIHSSHGEKVKKIISMIPKNGGSRSELPKEYWLECHKKSDIGYSDVYGRLSWDKVSSTITGGCLNPSKGRFLHPEENRSITAREAALLQTFPKDYQFSTTAKGKLAQMIGNAFPPKFSELQGKYIMELIDQYKGTSLI
ncbi:DNA cytosine methyltransferase [Bacillus stercoris]|uniref:Cytosine-specific methyltransferase n=1 Tax=Bacillus stercoris TaxID=2054641 RepID=A0ABU0V678_9BACI|nr:DNA cytosine methyltransferase [Bacillus stercoris]MDQ1852410.1 DNA cytosine methyltransferase [Bacillus stercoris]